jgi:hypothetical protein
MKKFVFLGLFAFFLLMQIPFIFSLDSDICHNISRSYRSDCKEVLHMDLSDHDKLDIINYLKDSHYRSDCREILHMDLSDHDKLYLVNHLKDSYYLPDVETYTSPFLDNIQVVNDNYSNYDPKENLKNKLWLIFNLAILFSFSYFYYSILKKGFRGNKWTAE